jgi:hypothetical protein
MDNRILSKLEEQVDRTVARDTQAMCDATDGENGAALECPTVTGNTLYYPPNALSDLTVVFEMPSGPDVEVSSHRLKMHGVSASWAKCLVDSTDAMITFEYSDHPFVHRDIIQLFFDRVYDQYAEEPKNDATPCDTVLGASPWSDLHGCWVGSQAFFALLHAFQFYGWEQELLNGIALLKDTVDHHPGVKMPASPRDRRLRLAYVARFDIPWLVKQDAKSVLLLDKDSGPEPTAKEMAVYLPSWRELYTSATHTIASQATVIKEVRTHARRFTASCSEDLAICLEEHNRGDGHDIDWSRTSEDDFEEEAFTVLQRIITSVGV